MYHVRIARPVRDLEASARLYSEGLGWVRLGGFTDHDGFDGVMIGEPDGSLHLEFTVCRTHPTQPAHTEDDLIVFYVPEAEWAPRCGAMEQAGFQRVKAFNPFWEVSGATFEDPDGYRVVIQRGEWKPGRSPS